ncbi:hypothetical protein NA57DRAFT_52952 [Rhizodiscina lignyota]|uniref:Uncharacterized protein n=1 Tax=Rhizodiscina lignyota TaxID=1504668 RepID=A0A9P4IKX0_9PEZI|nr:hypothetical protein NA57DRAFT_52952 [Rhizodiscina lignyota]
MNQSPLARIKKFIVHILSCCDHADDHHTPLQIGAPTDFRHMDVTLPGLTEDEQTFIREKAVDDAARMFANSPNTQATHPSFPDYQIPAPRSSPSLPHFSSPLPGHQRRMSRVVGHARKLSASFMGVDSAAVSDEEGPLIGGQDAVEGASAL